MLAQNSGLERKLPRGTIWASPNKPSGYLRTSTLTILAESIGDSALPPDLVESGTFIDTDPFTSSGPAEDRAHIKLVKQAGNYNKKFRRWSWNRQEEEEEKDEYKEEDQQGEE